MKKNVLTAALCAVLGCAATSPTPRAFGQELDRGEQRPIAAAGDDSFYYAAPPERQPQPNIAQQKAMARAEQRMARLAAMRAYGMSGGRPTASAMAFTTMYSPAWQMPGGRPFGFWHYGNGGMIIYRSANTPVYR